MQVNLEPWKNVKKANGDEISENGEGVYRFRDGLRSQELSIFSIDHRIHETNETEVNLLFRVKYYQSVGRRDLVQARIRWGSFTPNTAIRI